MEKSFMEKIRFPALFLFFVPGCGHPQPGHNILKMKNIPGKGCVYGGKVVPLHRILRKN